MKPTTYKKPGFKALMDRRLAQAGPLIRDLARLKYGAEDIGPKIGRTPTTVRRYAKTLNIALPTNGRTVFRLDRTGWREKIQGYMAEGMTLGQMAAQLGCSESAVCKWVLNQGLRRINRDRR